MEEGLLQHYESRCVAKTKLVTARSYYGKIIKAMHYG